MLISCTSSPGSVQPINEAAVRCMARHTPRPVIFALSSPTSELSAAQAYHWSGGKAMYANFEGPQEEVTTPEGQILMPSKVQSVYVFPGVALGTCVTRCARAPPLPLDLPPPYSPCLIWLVACTHSVCCLACSLGCQ